MAVEFASPPGSAHEIALTGFQNLARFTQRSHREGEAGMQALPETDVTLSAPRPVHHLGLLQIVARESIRNSAATGWQYLVLTEDGAVASSELSIGSDERPPVLEQVNMGPFVQSTASALRGLDDIPDVQSGRYELRTLKIPALWAFLLWLRQLDGNADLYIALSPAPKFLQAGRIYHEGELLDALEGPARKRLEFDNSPRSRTEN
ncbi:hypothetical protein OG689_43120 [Kitasatospora sp. NBC_00240]|uniref:hypothetical protein n=1 Tax=Kitasatospora sp. NBC_00240 TaxID=2903567 RepID=UPI00224F9715|nr:hypothetical protein [Kitasatospora sp. NBC_00240]MCX5215934.1 hypothetical protein [Kitasatospora sp. NBC_00240]